MAIVFWLIIASFLYECKEKNHPALDMDNYFAWCIVPFDSIKRTPEQRVEMLKELGFKSYAYDWRDRHLSTMAHEIGVAQENDIAINAIWMWIDVVDSIGSLSENNERILEIIDATDIETQIWVGISEAWFEGLSHNESLTKAAGMIGYLSDRASELDCKVGLYNHGGWYGDPNNQVELIKSLPDKSIGIIFNFHHAHDHLHDYPIHVEHMAPYLWAVNLNGMTEEGPKILPIGEGDLENTMIKILEREGFNGPYGILGHVEEADVKVVLQRNLDGLSAIL